MFRLICPLILVLLIVTPSVGQQSLVGTYKIVSHEVQVNGTLTHPMGNAPNGYLVFTPTRWITFLTAEKRKFGTSVDDMAKLLDTLVAWSGKYRVEGDRIIISVDASWTEVWTGRDLVRRWTLSGNRLTLLSDPAPFPKDPSKTAAGRQVWEKIE